LKRSLKLQTPFPAIIVAEQGELLEINLAKYFGGENLKFSLESD